MFESSIEFRLERMQWFLLLALAFQLNAKSADKKTCSARELRRFDCRLVIGARALRLLPETVAREDGVWHTVDQMPLKGDWEKFRFEIMDGRPILQMWIWDSGSGESQVQSLHWYVTEVGQAKMEILADGVVRRRRVRAKEPKTDFIYDGWEKHELKARKGGGLDWRLGTQSKLISKTDTVKQPPATDKTPHQEGNHGI